MSCCFFFTFLSQKTYTCKHVDVPAAELANHALPADQQLLHFAMRRAAGDEVMMGVAVKTVATLERDG